MMRQLANNKDFLAGFLFLLIGTVVLWVSRDYPIGAAARMGSGYFPTVIAGILELFGLYLMWRGWRAGGGDALEWGWRPLACITASIVLFGFLLPRVGLVPALVVLIFTAAAGGREFRLAEVLTLAAVMTVFAVAVFVYVLKLPFQLVPGVYFL